MDTTKDIRIAFMERIVATLAQQARSGLFGPTKKKPHVAAGLHEVSNLLLAMKYSYADDAALHGMSQHEAIRSTLERILETLREGAKGDKEKGATLRFYGHCVEQFQRSFASPSSVESCIAVDVGRVVTTSKHPKSKNLLLCHVEAFGESLMVVTNLVKTRPGQPMKLAMVPPSEIMGILSEAQFLGEASSAELEARRVTLTEGDRQEIRRSAGRLLEG